MSKMQIFYAPTPNGWKISCMVEELVEDRIISKDDFEIVPVNLSKGEQFQPEFLKVSPNGRIPALKDGDVTIFESGAIMIYLAEKFGKFYDDKNRVNQWLFWTNAGLGPMAGQVSHFVNYAPNIAPENDHSYSLERYRREFNRLLSVMDVELRTNGPYLAGEKLSIADLAAFPWVLTYKPLGCTMDDKPDLRRWYNSMKSRPGVQRGVDTLKTKPMSPKQAKEAAAVLFKKSKM